MTESKDGIFDSIKAYTNAVVILLVGELILQAIKQALKRQTKKDLEQYIILLESRITTKHIELNDEVIIP